MNELVQNFGESYDMLTSSTRQYITIGKLVIDKGNWVADDYIIIWQYNARVDIWES